MMTGYIQMLSKSKKIKVMKHTIDTDEKFVTGKVKRKEKCVYEKFELIRLGFSVNNSDEKK